MEREIRGAPPQEYGNEQFIADLETHLEMKLVELEHELSTLNDADKNVLETGAQRVRFEKGKKGGEAAVQEIENSANGFIKRELRRDEIPKEIEATKRALARLSK